MPNIYDQVLYPGLALPQTHPNQLATLATVFGIEPASIEQCRVLELGCGDGGNLIPMALELPESEFLGIDLSERAIGQGREAIETLGLSRIHLRRLDLLEVAADLGEFDYIIAHGIYSWVPLEQRERILQICRENLAPHGVSYVSYNAYPGFHRREMFREMMLYHVRNAEVPDERVRHGVEMVQVLAAARRDDEVPRALLEEELQHFADSAPWYLYHDDLAQTNQAFYFHEFMECARRHRLQYLAEADIFEMQEHVYPEPVAETLRRFAGDDVVLKEQYLDFIKGRRFRQTLLCREEVRLNRDGGPERMSKLHLASAAHSVSTKRDLASGALEEFRGPRGAALETDHAAARAALLRLGAVWPQSLPFGELTEILGDREMLAEILWQAYSTGLIEAYVRPWHFAAIVSEQPVASPLARMQALSGTLVTNLRHTSVELEDETDQLLLLLLDGLRDRSKLLEESRAAESPLTSEALEMRLDRLAKQALLAG